MVRNIFYREEIKGGLWPPSSLVRMTDATFISSIEVASSEFVRVNVTTTILSYRPI